MVGGDVIAEVDMKSVSRDPVPRNMGSIFVYFLLWYSFNIIYNIYTKPALEDFPLPACITFCQLLIGSVFVIIMWQFKPIIGFQAAMKGKTRKIIYTSLCHALGSCGTQLSFHVGTVGFTNVLKSGEPLFSALFSFLLMSKIFSWKVYASLVVIVIGISLASIDEMSFSWTGLLACNIANCFYPLRMVLSKQMMSDDDVINSNPILAQDLFRIITIVATVCIIPICLLEILNSDIAMQDIWIKLSSSSQLAYYIFLSGSAYYIYNEVKFWILNLVQPITHAVANTSKRCLLIYISCIFFGTELSLRGTIGSAIAVFGTLIYAVLLSGNKN